MSGVSQIYSINPPEIDESLLKDDQDSFDRSKNSTIQLISLFEESYKVNVDQMKEINNQSSSNDIDDDPNLVKRGLYAQIQSYGNFPLHKIVFNKNFQLLQQCLLGRLELFTKEEINQQDQRGNTPLILAGKLSAQDQEYIKAVNILLDAGANIKQKDIDGWSLSQIARSQKNINLYSILFDFKHQNRKLKWGKKRILVLEKLQQIPDFYLEIKWDLISSFIPIIHKFLPSDTFKIWKIGTNLRFDFNFVGMHGIKAKKRSMSVIFRDGRLANHLKGSDLLMINHDKETVINMMEDFDFEERLAIINEIMHADPIQGNLKKFQIQGKQDKTFFGFPIFDNINGYKSQRYKVEINTNVQYQRRKNENQSNTTGDEQQLLSNPELYFNTDLQQILDIQEEKRKSLPKKEKNIDIKCNLWITKDFPINIQVLLTIFKTLTSSGDIGDIGVYLDKIQQYLNNQDIKELLYNDGFPIKIQIPIMYSIQANIAFSQFKYLDFGHLQGSSQERENYINQIFEIPQSFTKISRRIGTKMLANRKKVLVFANLSA